MDENEKRIEMVLQELRAYGRENEVPNITDANARYLKDAIRSMQAKRVLEIGTANGYSTICFASDLVTRCGHIDSIEFSAPSHRQAIENVRRAGLEATCTLIFGQALDIIPTLPDGEYDFVFIDGMKRRTKDFLTLCLPKVRRGGMIIIDDVIKFKEKMVGLYELVEERSLDAEVIAIDGDDGIMRIVIAEDDIQDTEPGL